MASNGTTETLVIKFDQGKYEGCFYQRCPKGVMPKGMLYCRDQLVAKSPIHKEATNEIDLPMASEEMSLEQNAPILMILDIKFSSSRRRSRRKPYLLGLLCNNARLLTRIKGNFL